MYNQIRLVDASGATAGINAVLAGDNFIDAVSEDFQFQYGSNLTPLNQHPLLCSNLSCRSFSLYE